MTARTAPRRLTILATACSTTALLLAACTSDPGPSPTGAPTTAAPGPREPAPTAGPDEPDPSVGPGPGSNYLPITVDNIVGTWLTADESGWLWSFYADGSVLWTNPSPTDDGAPYGNDTYALTSGTLDTDGCDWELDIWADGMMYGVIVDGQECSVGELWPWARLSPAAGVASLELESVPTAAPTAPTDLLDVSHVWWRQESGHLLAITYDLAARTARYLLDDDGDPFTDPDDTGAVTIDEAGAVTLHSSGSASCPAGALVTLSGHLALLDGPATGLVWSWATESVGDAGACAAHERLGGTWVAVT